MIVIFGLIAGAIVGTRKAAKRGGNRADKLQYGAVYAIAFGIVGMLVTVILDRVLS